MLAIEEFQTRLDNLEQNFRKLCRIVFHHGKELPKTVRMEQSEYQELIKDYIK